MLKQGVTFSLLTSGKQAIKLVQKVESKQIKEPTCYPLQIGNGGAISDMSTYHQKKLLLNSDIHNLQRQLIANNIGEFQGNGHLQKILLTHPSAITQIHTDPAIQTRKHNPQYAEMFKDGVLDMTLGLGFDEGGNDKQTLDKFEKVLDKHQFKNDRAAASEIYQKSGRKLGPSEFGVFFVRKNALTYQPGKGQSRKIHAVIRLVSNVSGSQGEKAANAFTKGLINSDITYYQGHGRYGSGPDFDRNLTIDYQGRKGVVERVDYEELEKRLKIKAQKRHTSVWNMFKYYVAHKRIQITFSNSGNLYINPDNQHSKEFGAKLLYWALKKQNVKRVTGKRGKLAKGANTQSQRHYRLWVFDGCRTKDYVKSIRATPGLHGRSVDVIASKRVLYWDDASETLASFLDSVLNQQSAEEIITGMDKQQDTKEKPTDPTGDAFEGYGLTDNP